MLQKKLKGSNSQIFLLMESNFLYNHVMYASTKQIYSNIYSMKSQKHESEICSETDTNTQ